MKKFGDDNKETQRKKKLPRRKFKKGNSKKETPKLTRDFFITMK
jgi:hypothetical protein